MGKINAVSPFAPEKLAKLPPIEGVRFATAEAGIRYKGRTDLMVACLDEGTVAAGVLMVAAAPSDSTNVAAMGLEGVLISAHGGYLLSATASIAVA